MNKTPGHLKSFIWADVSKSPTKYHVDSHPSHMATNHLSDGGWRSQAKANRATSSAKSSDAFLMFLMILKRCVDQDKPNNVQGLPAFKSESPPHQVPCHWVVSRLPLQPRILLSLLSLETLLLKEFLRVPSTSPLYPQFGSAVPLLVAIEWFARSSLRPAESFPQLPKTSPTWNFLLPCLQQLQPSWPHCTQFSAWGRNCVNHAWKAFFFPNPRSTPVGSLFTTATDQKHPPVQWMPFLFRHHVPDLPQDVGLMIQRTGTYTLHYQFAFTTHLDLPGLSGMLS